MNKGISIELFWPILFCLYLPPFCLWASLSVDIPPVFLSDIIFVNCEKLQFTAVQVRKEMVLVEGEI